MPARRLQVALAAYAFLAAAGTVLTDGNARYVLWIVLGGLALKTFAAHRIQQLDEARRAEQDQTQQD